MKTTIESNRAVHFRKLHVCGNDFVFTRDAGFDQPAKSALAIEKCRRDTGIGGDQMVFVSFADGSAIAEIFNPDGTLARFCGNACLALHAYVESEYGKIEILDVQLSKETVRVSVEAGERWLAMPQAEVIHGRRFTIPSEGWTVLSLVFNGTHHLVVLGDSLEGIDPLVDGPRLSEQSAIEGGVNVMFVCGISENGFAVRPWERGGSGATQACASGSAAVATALALQGHEFVDRIYAKCPGGDLWLRKLDAPKRWLISGKPQETYSGTFYI